MLSLLIWENNYYPDNNGNGRIPKIIGTIEAREVVMQDWSGN